MDALQIEDGKYWQCQDTPSIYNYQLSTENITTTDWWTTCFSNWSCAWWDAAPTLNMTTVDGGYDMMLTTYVLFQNSSYFDKYVDNMTASQNYSGSPTTYDTSCQLMVSWSNDSSVSNTSIWMGTPFFRQYQVAADFSDDAMLYFTN